MVTPGKGDSSASRISLLLASCQARPETQASLITSVGVAVGVSVGVAVDVGDGVAVAVWVGVAVGVWVAVGVAVGGGT